MNKNKNVENNKEVGYTNVVYGKGNPLLAEKHDQFKMPTWGVIVVLIIAFFVL